MTSPWYSPELATNIALAYVPVADAGIPIGTTGKALAGSDGKLHPS